LSARAETGPPDIPGYEVQAEVGAGGQGVIYKARQLSTGRLVALKVMRAGGTADREQLTHFRGEAALMARLHHPHIVRVYEQGDVGGCPFIAMEFVEGGSLDERIAGRPQPPRWAARLVEGLARGAHHAHRQGVVHLDLKPANVLLTVEGAPKIIDFGLARRLDTGEGRGEASRVSGTPGYMAPEQADGNARAFGPPTDVHGLGAVLYKLLTGRAPFQGDSVLDMLCRTGSSEPEPASRLRADVPPVLETICMKCLRKAPGQRYAGADALADCLGRFLAAGAALPQ
jgi:serine/threonine-protein kinase